ncbi:MAG: tyrosine--tRNA ligase [Planctomycetota bacterium]
MSLDQRLDLIRRNTAELLGADRLRAYLEKGLPIKHYIGFEISGEIHLGSGLVCMSKLVDFQKAGLQTTVFLADWHSWINDKLGGDADLIRRIARGYFAEGMKACIAALGGDPTQVEFVLGSDLYAQHPTYWDTVIEVSKNTSLARILRSITVLGREEGEAVDFAKLIYPPMQAADIFAMGITLAHAGEDQRKAQVIALDCAEQMQRNGIKGPDGKLLKPIAVHHPLLMGLTLPPGVTITKDMSQEDIKAIMVKAKMSKSVAGSAIYITDEPKLIQKKINKAYCPPDDVLWNPVLNWARVLHFQLNRGALNIDRPAQYGGPVSFATYADLETAYQSGSLFAGDLKAGVAQSLIELLKPVREHFAAPDRAAMLAEMQKVKLTR